MNKSLYVWDLTLKWSNNITPLDIITDLKSLAKKFGFQQEIGDKNGYRHYQIRISLIKKATEMKVVALLKSTCMKGANVSRTCNETSNDIYYYTTKLDSRVEGTQAYTDKDPLPTKMTRQLTEFYDYTPYEWQKTAYSLAKEKNNRVINVIYDPKGNNGKSIFCEWVEYEGIAEEIPTCNSYEDISTYVCSRRTKGFESNCYLIDMPRGLKKERLSQFYSGIEIIKNGVCFDKRYSANKLRFDRPQIIVFTNTLPQEMECLTSDRWRIYCLVQSTKQLEDITSQLFPTDFCLDLDD